MRSIWKGTISFGLINIPVRLYSASKTRELKFKLLHQKDLSEIRYARICKIDGKEVPWEEIVKGYEVEEGEYAVLSEADFEKANLKKSRSIEIIDFTKEDEIDSIYYENPYFLEAEKTSLKAYRLLLEVLKKSKKVAIGNFVFHHREHIGVIKPYGNILILNKLPYESELVNPKELNVPQKTSINKREMEVALQLIDKLTKPFNPKNYTDTYTKELKSMIKRKTAKGKTHIEKEEKPAKSAKVHDIMTLLKQSLQDKKKKKSRKTA